jgi:hypothetical protein
MLTRLLILGLISPFLAFGLQAQAPSKPIWSYAHDVRVRKGGATEFDRDTPRIGIEFFQESVGQSTLAITQSGQLAVVPTVTPTKDNKATWSFAHDLRVRKAAEEQFTKDTGKFGVEVFKDGPSNKLLYVSEKGFISLANLPEKLITDRGPSWHHGLIVKVRNATEANFGKDTKQFGLEIFRDENTGGLIYICETLSIATSQSKAVPPQKDQVKSPKGLYGLTLRVRSGDEIEFTSKTKKIGVEVFEDENSGDLIYISEMGSIAVVPAPKVIDTGKGVTWQHAFSLKARAGGETNFDKAKKYGVELFLDNNTGAMLYISETGSLAVKGK